MTWNSETRGPVDVALVTGPRPGLLGNGCRAEPLAGGGDHPEARPRPAREAAGRRGILALRPVRSSLHCSLCLLCGARAGHKGEATGEMQAMTSVARGSPQTQGRADTVAALINGGSLGKKN